MLSFCTADRPGVCASVQHQGLNVPLGLVGLSIKQSSPPLGVGAAGLKDWRGWLKEENTPAGILLYSG